MNGIWLGKLSAYVLGMIMEPFMALRTFNNQ